MLINKLSNSTKVNTVCLNYPSSLTCHFVYVKVGRTKLSTQLCFCNLVRSLFLKKKKRKR